MNQIKGLVLGVCLACGGLGGTVVPLEAWGEPMDAVGQPERQALVAEVVTPFLEALQTGDAPALAQLIGGKLALTLGKLLRENTEYPNFLRQRYGDTMVSAPIQIVQHHEASSQPQTGQSGPRLAAVHLQTPSGGQDHFQLTLEQDAQGAWKVTDKVMVR